MIERNRTRADIQNCEIGQHPIQANFPRPAAHVLRFDPARGQQQTGAMRPVAQFTVRKRVCWPDGLRASSAAREPQPWRPAKQLAQQSYAEAVTRPATRASANEAEGYVAAQPRQSEYIEDNVIPADPVRMERMLRNRQRLSVRYISDIAAVKGISQFLDIGPINLD